MESSPSKRSNVTTPKSNFRKSTSFSPVQIEDSPVCRSPQAGNLTGNPRIVRDNAAELFNLIQDWNANHLNGVSILSDITTLKLSNLRETNREHTDDYPLGLSRLLEDLDEICKKLTVIVERMNGISKEIHAIIKLEHLRQENPTPMFLTWNPEKFGDTTDKIHESYLKELKMKHYIKENVAHSFDRKGILFYSAAWLHQPYVDDLVNVMLEAMLKETSHR